MKEHKLVEETMDWFLPNMHERVWWSQFMQGGRTFLDVGAHVGTWTLNIGHCFERVFCFEPDPRGANALRNNVKLAGLKNVEVIQAAVGARDGEVELSLYPNPCTNTTLPNETGRGVGVGDTPTGVMTVPLVALDTFVKERGITDVDFIKVDTEGAECMVIQGALEMWRTQRPDFFVEMHGPFHRECRKLLDFEECDAIDMGGWGFSLVRHRAAWSFEPQEHQAIYPHGTDATDADLSKVGGRERWLQFRPVLAP